MSVTSLKTRQKYGSLLAGNEYYIPPSFESIASATGTGSSNTITFSSIPGTYQHLQIRGLFKSTGASDGGDLTLTMRFNNDSGTNYVRHTLRGNGSAASGLNDTAITSIYVGSGVGGTGTTNMLGANIIDIHDYASTTKNKTTRSFSGGEINTTPSQVLLNSGLWLSTAAITSISLIDIYGNFTTSSTFALYGIKGA